MNDEGRISGRAQSAVRPLSSKDFERILALGLDDNEPLLPRVDDDLNSDGFSEAQVPFVLEQDRTRVNYLASRLVRDRVFRKIVLRAYDARCVVTGLKLINGGGRAEVAAALFDRSKPADRTLSAMAWPFQGQRIACSTALDLLARRSRNPDLAASK